jgi:hypothetical protein
MTDQTPAPAAPDPNTSSTEPLVTVATITALAAAALGLAVTFGLHLAPDQQAAVLGVVGVLAPVVVAVWGRRRVYSPATVVRLLAAARRR